MPSRGGGGVGAEALNVYVSPKIYPGNCLGCLLGSAGHGLKVRNSGGGGGGGGEGRARFWSDMKSECVCVCVGGVGCSPLQVRYEKWRPLAHWCLRPNVLWTPDPFSEKLK